MALWVILLFSLGSQHGSFLFGLPGVSSPAPWAPAPGSQPPFFRQLSGANYIRHFSIYLCSVTCGRLGQKYINKIERLESHFLGFGYHPITLFSKRPHDARNY
jgi:hypothetical protein